MGLGLGCQQKPTVMSGSAGVLSKNSVLTHRIQKQFSSEKKIVLLDARQKFDFEAFHLPGSINFNLDEVQVRNARGAYVLNPDLFKISRRLANYGVDPSSQVILLGYGPSGRGEEAAMAFYLRMLGLDQVFAVAIDNFRAHPFPQSPLQSLPLWKPRALEIFVDKEKLEVLLKDVPRFSPNSKARAAALQSDFPLESARGLLIADELVEPDWFKSSKRGENVGFWSTQVLNPIEFVDKQGLWTSENVRSRLNFSSFQIVVIQSRDIEKSLALGYVAHLAGAPRIVLLRHEQK